LEFFSEHSVLFFERENRITVSDVAAEDRKWLTELVAAFVADLLKQFFGHLYQLILSQ